MWRLFVLLSAAAAATPVAAADRPAWFAKAVKKVEAAFDPAEAKPGQTVTLRFVVHLADGYHTYPLAQPDKAAAGMVNKLTFPPDAPLVFVGEPADPADAKVKSEPLLGIDALVYLPGKVVYSRRAVVPPTAGPGPLTASPSLRLSVCSGDNCYPPQAVTAAATLKVLPGPAVPVDKKFADEVRKAAAGK